MPIYEYQCNSCNEKFETLVFDGKEPQECLYCNEKEIVRLMSTCSFSNGCRDSNNNTGHVDNSGTSSSCGSCTASNCSGCS